MSEFLSAVRLTVDRFPDRPAVSDVARTLTYREFWREVELYAASRARTDGGRANPVEARASVDFAVAAVGTYLAGRVFVPFPKDAPDDLTRRMKDETSVPMGSNVADVLYTTGTTGMSKGVMVSHHAAWAAADNNRLFDRITEETVYLIASPLNHVSALRKLYACFLVGAHAVLQDGFLDVKRYCAAIERHRVNALLLPPAAAAFLLLTARDRLHALAGRIAVVHSNGSPMTETLKDSLRRCLPETRLVFAYGATEAGSACCAYDYARFPGRVNCVGKAGPHATVTVEDGCLVVTGESVMNGYLNDPVRTAEVLRGGRLYTHDLGHVDPEGFLHVIGRTDDIINCGGMKVAPSDVEEVAMGYPGVSDCVCFGVDVPLTGSAVKLNIVPRDAPHFDLVAFRRFLGEHLERHQLPSRIECVTDIPRTRNGKTDRRHLV